MAQEQAISPESINQKTSRKEFQNVKLQFKEKNYRSQEAFKTLRSNIEFCGDDIQVIAVTSCTPNEGKSSVAMELAKAFSQSGNRTLLIDADLRKSVLVGRYKTGSVKVGLTHYLVGRKNIDDIICTTDIPNLYITFSGPVPPNPSELIRSSRFTELLDISRKAFKYIIVDTPPLGSVIDSAIAATKCDGTILVVEANAISYHFAQSVKDQLDKSGCRILGAVLNKVDMTGKGQYGHYGRYYGKYYGKYYGDYYGQSSSEGGGKSKGESKAKESLAVKQKTEQSDDYSFEYEDEQKNSSPRGKNSRKDHVKKNGSAGSDKDEIDDFQLTELDEE